MAGVPILVLATAPTGPMRLPMPLSDLPAHTSSAHIGPSISPPDVEPAVNYALPTDKARALNAAIPFSARANPAASPFHFVGDADNLSRAVDCLAAAQIYEAGDDAVGEQAVAQVVLNRARHPAFPKSICGVVFQGQERATGCQFTFTCDGALARTPPPAAWDRARIIARAALAGAVFKPVGLATHYHTDWVVPYWSASLDKTARVGTHLFFRWAGKWGTAAVFQDATGTSEPVIGRIARLSLAHRTADASSLLPAALHAGQEAGVAGLAKGQVMPPANKNWTPSPETRLTFDTTYDPVRAAIGSDRNEADRRGEEKTVIALRERGHSRQP
ncbi:Cell wall hydrolase CwlJ, involved in spore germination [Sphingobium sp. AP50]|nr:Cell wall hydrolase CwlJ, involved in spore germination [Sphingobium sp. AP50]SEJ70833.1 Cell wall hydrolase CwlJ, involved in spore germination [Sphingobium sp. AP50]